MERGVSILIFVLAIFMVGLLVYFALESRGNDSYADGKVPYSNINSGLFSELTPPSILDSKDIEFWSTHRTIKKQFFMETKFGQSKENNELFNYTISDAEDCEKEFDKKNYPVPVYYQTAGLGIEKYNLYPVRACWIESVYPIKLECEGTGGNESCLYTSQISCVCLYGSEE